MLDLQTLPNRPDDGYALIRAEATSLAGAPADIAQRVILHHSIYRDSAGNHAFPLIALHGALWAASFFETTGRIGDALRLRYFYNPEERAYRMQLLATFAEGFKTVNRAVFIDTYTNYYYTRRYNGPDAASAAPIHPDLYTALQTMHQATRARRQLPPAQKRHLFLQALQHEQEVTVAPGVQAEIERFDCPILRFLCLRPVVHLAYFPHQTYLIFRNFPDKTERIAKAVSSYDIAAKTGWPLVEARAQASRLLPTAYRLNPDGHIQNNLP